VGHNDSRYKLKALGADAQIAVDEYKARSVWGAWWSLPEATRRRFFTADERKLITRYGARLDELACLRDNPRDDSEKHFIDVCVTTGTEPRSAIERLWLLVQVVCRYQRSVERAARADMAEHDAVALWAENRALKAQNDHLELFTVRLQRELKELRGDAPRSLCNVDYVTPHFRVPEFVGPRQAWRVIG